MRLHRITNHSVLHWRADKEEGGCKFLFAFTHAGETVVK
jgi:hypothetical protein